MAELNPIASIGQKAKFAVTDAFNGYYKKLGASANVGTGEQTASGRVGSNGHSAAYNAAPNSIMTNN